MYVPIEVVFKSRTTETTEREEVLFHTDALLEIRPIFTLDNP